MILSRDVFRNDFWSDGVSKLVEGGETGVPEEAGCSHHERDRKLQSDSPDIGDVQVVRIMYPLALGEGKKSPKSVRICILVEWMGLAANTCK